MNMIKVRALDLAGAQLDYAVAITLGYNAEILQSDRGPWCHREQNIVSAILRGPFFPSTEWADGGPIIQDARIMVVPHLVFDAPSACWRAMKHGFESQGDTPLIAAMRCFVLSKQPTFVPQHAVLVEVPA